jgi:hypothetical protein
MQMGTILQGGRKMKTLQNIEVPEALRQLPQDKRGLPIPYIVFVDSQGEPHFRINDYEKDLECVTGRKCHVCGQPLKREFWFIGGQLSAFHPRGAFNDGPVHKACGLFALKVCPYLAYSGYKAVDDQRIEKLADRLQGEGLAGLYNPTQTPDRLPFFILAKAKEYASTFNEVGAGHKAAFHHPRKPYEQVEYWRHGQRIHRAEALQLLKEKGEKSYLP